MQALVSFVQDDKDNLRSIVSGDHQIVFVCRGPLVLVAVSQTCQSVSQVCEPSSWILIVMINYTGIKLSICVTDKGGGGWTQCLYNIHVVETSCAMHVILV